MSTVWQYPMEGDNVTNRVRNEPATIQTNDQIQTSSIKLAHTNINSIRNKLDDVAAELSDYDIIGISESKLNNSIPSSMLMLDSYNMPIRKDREINNGGGLIIYIKNNIFFKRRDDLENNSIENILLETNFYLVFSIDRQMHQQFTGMHLKIYLKKHQKKTLMLLLWVTLTMMF